MIAFWSHDSKWLPERKRQQDTIVDGPLSPSIELIGDLNRLVRSSERRAPVLHGLPVEQEEVHPAVPEPSSPRSSVEHLFA